MLRSRVDPQAPEQLNDRAAPVLSRDGMWCQAVDLLRREVRTACTPYPARTAHQQTPRVPRVHGSTRTPSLSRAKKQTGLSGSS